MGKHKVEERSPILAKSGLHDQLHILPMAICAQEDRLALLS